MTRLDDLQALRQRAIERLGALGPPLAYEALDSGELEVEHDVLAWTGTMGTVHGHRVVLWLTPGLCAEVNAASWVVDALTAAIASAVAEVPGNALAELEVGARTMSAARVSPYRGRMA